MKKIIFFLYSFPGGGAERTVLNIINNINKKAFEPVLVLGNDRDAPYLEHLSDHVKVISLNVERPRDCILPLRRVIIKENPDIVFSTINGNNLILTIAKVLSFRKSKLIVREANNRTQSGRISLVNKIMTKTAYNVFVDKVIALSNGVKEDLITNFKINRRKIAVIYNPIEVNFIKDMASKSVDDFDFSNNAKKIISVGRLVEQKDYPTLLKAFSLLKDENIQLLILGQGVLEDKLKKITRDLEIEDKVFFLGFKKNPYKYIQQADLFVLSSKWEGFGHVIVEAMASGTPVVATNCKSGPSEIIGDNEYGVLVPVQNADALARGIIELLRNKSKMDRYQKKGLNRANDFIASKIVLHYEEIFNGL